MLPKASSPMMKGWARTIPDSSKPTSVLSFARRGSTQTEVSTRITLRRGGAAVVPPSRVRFHPNAPTAVRFHAR